MKKNKLNNSGFVLVETLIVTVFIMSIFAILYNNFYPLIGEYEKREAYDDVDGKYAAYWFKKVIEDTSTTINTLEIGSDGYTKFNCTMVSNEDKKNMCEKLVQYTQVYEGKDTSDTSDDYPHIYITRYELDDIDDSTVDFKDKIDNHSTFTGGMHRYINYLPTFASGSPNGALYRVIVEFHRTKDENDYMAYSTIEVIK